MKYCFGVARGRGQNQNTKEESLFIFEPDELLSAFLELERVI
jgi:hypothetical protein